VAGIESMVGLFINTVPVRLRIDARDTPARLVRQVQADALQGETHHYGSLADIQAVTPVKQDLLDHVLVFENYPLADALIGLEQRYPVNFSIDNIKIFEQTHYDLSIVVEPGDQTLRVVFQYNGTVLDEQFMTRIKTAFGTLLQQLPDAADKPLGELRESMLSPDEKKERDAFIRSVQQISEDF
jgi:non-ribosomal peptide synthetase component F